ATLGLTDSVRFLGAQPQERLRLFYAASDATVMPSYYESFGMVALEAMACGSPVIASRVGGLTTTVRDGVTGFLVPDGDATAFAVDDVSFSGRAGETVALVGESGCGKSVTALSIMRLLPEPAGRIAGGAVRFRDRDLLALPEQEMRAVRGREIAMIFQEPMTSLNPTLTIGRQLTEGPEVHLGLEPPAARARAVELLAQVGIPDPDRRLRDYPHQ